MTTLRRIVPLSGLLTASLLAACEAPPAPIPAARLHPAAAAPESPPPVSEPSEPQMAPAADALDSTAATALAPGCSWRVPEPAAPPVDEREFPAQASFAGGVWRCGPCRIDTPLPAGWPAPTPPGAVEIKHYPITRGAWVGGEAFPDVGSNMAFFTLFNHIKSRDLPMTSPVEMRYDGLAEEGSLRRWNMAFLYPTPQDGRLGEAGRVQVMDAAPATFLSMGVRGGYGRAAADSLIGPLKEVLAALPGWEAAGEVRVLFYNGPDVPSRNRWVEVQIPIRRSGP